MYKNWSIRVAMQKDLSYFSFRIFIFSIHLHLFFLKRGLNPKEGPLDL